MFPRVALVALALAAAGTCRVLSRQDPTACARNYTVVSGDTCDAISAKAHASTFQLATVNKAIIDPLCDNLFIGEVLCLGLIGEDCDVVQVVQSGDSCPAIAAAAGTNVQTLLANNPNVFTNCTNIYPGEVLCTASQVIVKS